jgi:type VII secretion integral membrane protein EccD
VGHPGIRLLVAAIGTCTAAALAVTARSTTAGIASVCLAAATGFLAVPEGLAPANFFLAAAAAASMALLMIRWIDDSSSTLIATAAFSFLAAVAALPAMITGISVASAGAVVGVVALGLLAMSGRMSILLSGLVPDRHTDDHDERALRGYAVLSGLIGGCSAGAALGTVLVAVGCHRHGAPALAGAALGTVAGVALLLRIRTHLDATCRWALALGGIACVSAAFVVTVSAWPDQTAWAGAAVVAIGLGAIRTPKLTSGAVRAVELLEYATLVAVVPLACWVGGVYAMVRGTPLP